MSMNAMRRVGCRIFPCGLIGLALGAGLSGCSPEGYESVKGSSKPAPTAVKEVKGKGEAVDKGSKGDLMDGIPTKPRNQ